MKLPHWTKAPEWSGFAGHVRSEDVWDRTKEEQQRWTNFDLLLQDALPLGNDHVVDTLIGFFRTPQSLDLESGSISAWLRKKVADAISWAHSLAREKRDALLWILDKKPKLRGSYVPPEKTVFEWSLSEFVTPEEETKLREWCHKELEVNKDTLRFEGPFLTNNEHVGHHWRIDMRYIKCNGVSFQSRKQGYISFGYPPTWWWDMIVGYKSSYYRVA